MMAATSMDAALNHLRVTGTEVRKEDLARLSPLSHKHFNMLGRYHFAVPEDVLRGELRPLRDLNDADIAIAVLWVATIKGPRSGGECV
jgi:hypothetical protein